MARITISPAELMAKETLETRLRAKDSKWEWSSGLIMDCQLMTAYKNGDPDSFNPRFASSADC